MPTYRSGVKENRSLWVHIDRQVGVLYMLNQIMHVYVHIDMKQMRAEQYWFLIDAISLKSSAWLRSTHLQWRFFDAFT